MKPRIMLVEDEKVVAADIEECVTGLGYEVVGSAATGTEALRMAVNATPDLVLMDIKLRGVLDGIDVAGALYNQLSRFQWSTLPLMPTPRSSSVPSRPRPPATF